MKTLFVCLFLVAMASVCMASEIRVRNATGTDLKNVVVGDRKYGDIKKEATTNYQHWELAFRY